MASLDRRTLFTAAGGAAAGMAAGAAATALAVESGNGSGDFSGFGGARSAVDEERLDFGDERDFEDADRGFVAALSPGVVEDGDGKVVWDGDSYGFLEEDVPETASRSLWRQSRLAAKQGLYKVTDRVYQVRGLDLSNMTLIEGDRGVVVVDPLISAETAAAALELYREHRGKEADRTEVTGLVFTHSHADHFGGCRGVLPDGGSEEVPVLAPQGFMQHAVSENVYAGTAMQRRAVYMYGSRIPRSPSGQIGCGLGQAMSTGAIGLIPPTTEITETGQVETVDGVEFEFQMTPGTEAPAELNFLLPGLRALCMAENATHTMHNIITLRGAQVRDPRVWAHYLDESIVLFGDRADVAFASHHWPTWGGERITALLEKQRDLYAYMHDQTLRMINLGMTGPEIAEEITLPPALAETWANRGYYGSLSHNVKGIYQRYMGWFDGNPAHLWEHPPAQAARRYVQALGGRAGALDAAKAFAEEEDLRFAATLLDHLVFADPDDEEAKEELAQVYTRLGHAAENAVWRNFYLTAAQELREGVAKTPTDTTGRDMLMALGVDQLIDSVAVRIDGPRAWDLKVRMDWSLPEQDEVWHLTLQNGVLTYRRGTEPDPDAGVVLTMTKARLLGLLGGEGLDGIEVKGDESLVQQVLDVVSDPDTDFAIVTP
ncbi:alkyl/aryl-sulfatase [Nocardiopsis potens]|uniref:alkyl/aryl-sulfatase n=1 Tax=Nocardiopsis potens TaxID=1246458 RepID=UPI00047804F1|nr:alkyl sulfatase dimerization domain-containing protein [Nocardiopsis potens]